MDEIFHKSGLTENNSFYRSWNLGQAKSTQHMYVYENEERAN